MKLQGFSRYEFTVRDNTMFVKNTETGRILRPVRDDYHYHRKYQLKDDNGNTVSCTELRIAYCVLNSVPMSQIRGKHIVGSVKHPRLRSEPPVIPTDEKMRKVRDIEFCLEKLKDFYLTGDSRFFIDYAKQSRYQAISTVSSLTSAPIQRLQNIYEEATNDFLKEIEDCNFTSIKPLFGMLCKCLKVRYFRNARKHHVSLDTINIERARDSSLRSK